MIDACEEMVTVRWDDCEYKLPCVFYFWNKETHKVQPWFYKPVGFRPPRENEYFVSGAVPDVWEAHTNYDRGSTPYLIVEPVRLAKLTKQWVKA